MQTDPSLDQEILLRSDLDSLTKICETNTYFQELCISEHFWKQYYQQYGLVLTRLYPTLPRYLQNFQVSQQIQKHTNQIIDHLEKSGLRLRIKELIVEDFQVEEFDYEELLDFIDEFEYENREQLYPNFVSRYVETRRSVSFWYDKNENSYKARFQLDGNRVHTLDDAFSRKAFFQIISKVVSRGLEYNLVSQLF